MNTAAQPFWKRLFPWTLAALGLTAIVAASYLALHIAKLNAQHTTLQLAILPALSTIELIRAKQLIYQKDHGHYAMSLQELNYSRSFNTSDYVFETSRTPAGYIINAFPGAKLASRMNDLKSWGGNFIAPVFYTDESGAMTSPTPTVTITRHKASK